MSEKNWQEEAAARVQVALGFLGAIRTIFCTCASCTSCRIRLAIEQLQRAGEALAGSDYTNKPIDKGIPPSKFTKACEERDRRQEEAARLRLALEQIRDTNSNSADSSYGSGWYRAMAKQALAGNSSALEAHDAEKDKRIAELEAALNPFNTPYVSVLHHGREAPEIVNAIRNAMPAWEHSK